MSLRVTMPGSSGRDLTPITRENIDEMLDKNQIQIQMANGNWWNIKRNGKTRTWKKDSNRLYIPYKFGYRNCYNITERDFVNGILNPVLFRCVP